MKLVTAKDLCEALGLDPAITTSVLIDVQPRKPIEVTVRQIAHRGLPAAFRRYVLVEAQSYPAAEADPGS